MCKRKRPSQRFGVSGPAIPAARRAVDGPGADGLIPGRGAGGALPANINLGALNGTNGFRLSGVTAGDFSGRTVNDAGDINCDGVDDLLIGAHGADRNGNGSGASYVVFGGAGVGRGGNLQLSGLDGTNGLKLSGATGDFLGSAVSAAGDVNDDGVDDVLIGAPSASPNGFLSGASYVVFGKATPPVPPVTCNRLPATLVGSSATTRSSAPRATTSSRDGAGTTSSAAARVTIGYSATEARTRSSAGLGTMS